MFYINQVCIIFMSFSITFVSFTTGIAVRTDNSSFYMHHKFVIIDNTRLLNGSFNWTRQAVTGNQENLLVTSDSQLVCLYKERFAKLWRQYKTKKDQWYCTCETMLYVPCAECHPAVKAVSYEKQKYNSVMDVHEFYCDNGNTSSF